jgi:uncharacterized membrane protein
VGTIMITKPLPISSTAIGLEANSDNMTNDKQVRDRRSSKRRIDLFLFGLAVLGAGVAVFHSAVHSHNILFMQWFTAIFNITLFVVGSLAMTAGAAMIYTSLTS